MVSVHKVNRIMRSKIWPCEFTKRRPDPTGNGALRSVVDLLYNNKDNYRFRPGTKQGIEGKIVKFRSGSVRDRVRDKDRRSEPNAVRSLQ